MKKFQEKNLRTQRLETNYCTFSYLFSEYMQTLKRKLGNDYQEINIRMEEVGSSVGVRLYELISLRERNKRETKILDQLKFVQQTIWKYLFGKPADSLERLKDCPNDYLIRDENPLLLKYVSEESSISPATFIVGILQGIFKTSGFNCVVSSQFHQDEKGNTQYPHTVFILKFVE